MRQELLEPGLLPVFRAYVIARIGAMLSIAGVFLGPLGMALEGAMLPTAVLYICETAFLMVYLFLPWLQRKLGRVYLPIALGVATVAPILEMRSAFYAYGTDEILEFWLTFPFLVVPLILVAWQYELREVIVFSLGLGLVEILVMQLLPQPRALHAVTDGGTILGRSLLFLVIGYIVSYLVSEQRRQRQELAKANRKLVRYTATLEQLAITRERNRLARELHDTLAHTLSELAVELDALSSLWEPEDPRAKRMLRHALVTTREGLAETRRALQALRASPLEDLGLALALRQLSESAAARGQFQLELDLPRDLGDLSPEVEHAFYRVAQEALENVVRHAQAKTVRVALRHQDGSLELVVADDGRGLLPKVAQDEHFGLRGMEERAELIHGKLEVDARPGKGTTVRLRAKVAED